MTPTFAAAAWSGLRAAAAEPWLVPVGVLVAAVRRVALVPALAVLGAGAVRGALSAAAAAPFDPAAPVRGILVALASPRLDALVLGLALAGALLAAALRVAWLSGALPTLGLALSGAARAPRFAAGVAYGMPRVLVTALLGLAVEAGAASFGATLALSALRVAARMPAAGAGAVLLAAGCALALTLALAVPVGAGAVADAALARAAVRGDGPARAFARGARRILARPGSFVLAALVFAAAGAIAPLSIEGLGGAVLGFARGVPPALLVGPNLMVAALAAVVAAALDVWWLATITSLACAGDPDR